MKKEYNSPIIKIVFLSNEEVMFTGGLQLSGVNPADKTISFDWDEL